MLQMKDRRHTVWYRSTVRQILSVFARPAFGIGCRW